MRVWVVLVEDRHIDVRVFVYLDAVAAVVRAKQLVRQHDRSEGELEEQEGSEQLTRNMIQDGWLYHATTGDDGARVRVMETTAIGPWPRGSIGG